MRKSTLAVLLAVAAILSAPVTASALGLDIEAYGAGGIGMGSSSNSANTGSPRLAINAGAMIDFYAVSVGPVELGLSAGAEYGYWNFHGETDPYFAPAPVPGTVSGKQVTDSTYSYLNIPVALVAHMKLPGFGLTLRAGGFGGYFLSGSSDYTISGFPAPYTSVNTSGTTTLDSSTTEQWNWGLHFSAGPDFSLGPGLTLSPSLEYNLGLTDTSVNSSANGTSKDTLSSLTANVGIRFSLF